jgi:DNA-binding transcriptional regulator YiaG
MTPKPFDFSKVEALRRHMLLTTGDMASLFGVSRMTYYGWVKGRSMRRTNEDTVRKMLKRLLAVMTDHGWPMPEVIAADQKQRMQRLLEILNS